MTFGWSSVCEVEIVNLPLDQCDGLVIEDIFLCITMLVIDRDPQLG